MLLLSMRSRSFVLPLLMLSKTRNVLRGMNFHIFVESDPSDESGEVDVEKERQEMEVRRNLFMANKRLESLETQKYKVASEFFTEVRCSISRFFLCDFYNFL